MSKPATPARRRTLIRSGTLLACVAVALAAVWFWHHRAAAADAGA